MLPFTFQNPTQILFGPGRIADIGKLIPEGSRILVTFGGGSARRTGVLDEVHAALKGRPVLEFGGIEPNPSLETLQEALTLIRRENVDFLLAVGGGSVLDGTKFLAAAARFEGDPWRILETRGSVIKDALPMGTVLTLPATGSEMNCGSVITRRGTQDKLPFFSPLVYPRFSVLDPTKTLSLPPAQVANGVVDAFVHITEQYLTYPVNARVQDRFAEGLLLTLIEEGPRALQEPENVDVRANFMWAATLALNGLIGAGVPQDWATHMIGHELTALHGIDHARTLALVLPALLEEKRDAKRDKLLQYASRVWGLESGDENARITAAIEATRTFFESLGIPTHLSAYGLDASHIPALVENLKRHGMVRLGEKQDIGPDTTARILERAL